MAGNKEILRKRFAELDQQFGRLRFVRNSELDFPHSPNEEWRQWGTSALHLIASAFRETSPHSNHFSERYSKCRGYENEVRGLYSIFQSAKQDFEGGYVFDFEITISGEVFGDFVKLAKTALGEGYKDVAAVLAAASLEDVLKKYAVLNGIDINDQDMNSVINALKSKGLVGGAQKSLLDAMPKLRNAALHADWGKISEPEVGSLIAYVEQLLLTKFSTS